MDRSPVRHALVEVADCIGSFLTSVDIRRLSRCCVRLQMVYAPQLLSRHVWLAADIPRPLSKRIHHVKLTANDEKFDLASLSRLQTLRVVSDAQFVLSALPAGVVSIVAPRPRVAELPASLRKLHIGEAFASVAHMHEALPGLACNAGIADMKIKLDPAARFTSSDFPPALVSLGITCNLLNASSKPFPASVQELNVQSAFFPPITAQMLPPALSFLTLSASTSSITLSSLPASLRTLVVFGTLAHAQLPDGLRSLQMCGPGHAFDALPDSLTSLAYPGTCGVLPGRPNNIQRLHVVVRRGAVYNLDVYMFVKCPRLAHLTITNLNEEMADRVARLVHKHLVLNDLTSLAITNPGLEAWRLDFAAARKLRSLILDVDTQSQAELRLDVCGALEKLEIRARDHTQHRYLQHLPASLTNLTIWLTAAAVQRVVDALAKRLPRLTHLAVHVEFPTPARIQPPRNLDSFTLHLKHGLGYVLGPSRTLARDELRGGAFVEIKRTGDFK